MCANCFLPELSEICTDIGIVDQGRVVLEGTMTDILNQINISSSLIISTKGNQDKAIEILRSHPSVQTIAIEQEDIVVGFTGDRQDEATLLKRLVDEGVRVYGFVREKGSLESVFMEITNHKEERLVLVHEG